MNVFRKWFGPSKAEVWQALSSQIGGTFVEGGFWKGDKVQATHGEWTVTLDTYAVSNGKSSTTYTRLRAPYVNSDNFRFAISRRGIFSDIGKWFGMQDIEVGIEPFDTDFIIKGNDASKVCTLFANAKLRDLLNAQPAVRFEVKSTDGIGYFSSSNLPSGTDELCFSVVGTIRDIDRLKHLFELFSETLDQLCKMGSAYGQAPLNPL